MVCPSCRAVSWALSRSLYKPGGISQSGSWSCKPCVREPGWRPVTVEWPKPEPFTLDPEAADKKEEN